MKLSAYFFLLFSLPIAARPLRVLTYDSMKGKGSLGAVIEKEFRLLCKECEVKFITTRESTGLLGKLRSDFRRGKKNEYDLVLGLDLHQYKIALSEKLIKSGRVLDRSPFALMVDTQKFPKKEWPHSWSQLTEKLVGKIIIEDPRTSATGIGWLRTIFEQHALDLVTAKTLVFRVFPSWSSAYAAFESGQSVAVWSYLTSEAYHRCHDLPKRTVTQMDVGTIPDPRYMALPLDEGYPVQEEWFSAIVGARHPQIDTFTNFVLARKIQEAIPQTNWMLPASSDIVLPDCYKGLTEVKTWSPVEISKPKELRNWIDQWSL